MLPKGPLGYAMIKKLKVYGGASIHTPPSSPKCWKSKGLEMIGRMEQWHRPSQVQRRPRVSEKGSGKITVNGKDIQRYFGRETSIMIAKQPLALTNHVETFDIQINVHGGGESGQAGAARHGITRALIDYDASQRKSVRALAS